MEDINVILSGTFFRQIDPARKPELRDAHLIAEDSSSYANLPKEGYQKTFPRKKPTYTEIGY